MKYLIKINTLISYNNKKNTPDVLIIEVEDNLSDDLLNFNLKKNDRLSQLARK